MNQPRLSLRSLMHRAHITLAMTSVAVVGFVLAVPALTALHIYADHDLRLIGRSVGYTVEAAVVFEDKEAAQEALTSIVADEDVMQATIESMDGRVLARWQDGATGWRASLAAAAAGLLYEREMPIPVLHDGAVVGQVRVRGGGRMLLRFLGFGALGIVLCQALIAAGALFLSSRIVGRIVRPLQTLADLTGTVQRERAFGRRVPGAEIRELNELGRSFNALLAELESWQTLMEGENRRLTHQASHDSLTGLANRAFFEGRLSRALVDAKQGGTGLAVMLIDCDRFKQINDGYGHAAGDAVLVAIAARLKGQMREHDLVARLGGDEFAILIAPSPDAVRSRGLVDAVGEAMRLPVVLQDEVSIPASLSIGLALYPEDGMTAAALLQHADESMYRAKRGRPAMARDPQPPS